MSRRTLTDAQWARIEPLVPGKAGDRGRSGADNRRFVDAVLWLARTAAPWRDLPPDLGNWRTVHCRFRRWTLSGVERSGPRSLPRDRNPSSLPLRRAAAQLCRTFATKCRFRL